MSRRLDKLKIKQLDEAFEKLIGNNGVKVPGMGVIIYKNGSEIYSKFLGNRTIDNENPKNNKPVTRETRFRVASISKMFTVFTILQLMEQGKINLDEDVSLYLNFQLRNPAYSQKKITVRMLAAHTSSLRDGKIYSIPPEVSIEEFFSPNGRYWENGEHFAPVEEKIGEYFTYSNLNYGILGTIIENVTGKRFDIYQKENILSQLKTKADYVPANFEREEFKLLGTVYQKKNSIGIWNEHGEWFGKADDFKGIQPPKNTISLQNPYYEHFQENYNLKDYQPGTNATIFSPQGGLRISFDELSHTLEMMMNNGIYCGNQILNKSSIEMMLQSQWIYNPKMKNGDTYGGSILNYGLGTYFIDGTSTARVCKDNEINLFGHTGVAFGMFSGIFFNPNTRDGFIYMINGTAIDEDNDPRSHGQFSGNYIWEEKIMDLICKKIID